MLPTIILFVTSVSLLEQDITRKGRLYENAIRCRNIWRKYEEVQDRWKTSNTLSQPVFLLILSTHNGLALHRKSAFGHLQHSRMAWPTTESTLPPSKLRLFVARTDEWLSTMHNQLSTIWHRRPEWRVASYWQYEYNDNPSEGLSVINNTTKTT